MEIEIEIDRMTGVYKNLKRDIVNIVFRGHVLAGGLRTSDETQEVGFFPINEETIDRMMTRPHFRERARDALSGSTLLGHDFEPFT